MLNDTKPAQNPAQAFSLLLPIKFGSRIRDVVSHFIAMCCRHDRTAQLIAPAIMLGKASRGDRSASIRHDRDLERLIACIAAHSVRSEEHTSELQSLIRISY